jgi:hypothetical protein
MKLKVQGLYDGIFGYNTNPAEAKALIEQKD